MRTGKQAHSCGDCLRQSVISTILASFQPFLRPPGSATSSGSLPMAALPSSSVFGCRVIWKLQRMMLAAADFSPPWTLLVGALETLPMLWTHLTVHLVNLKLSLKSWHIHALQLHR